MSKTAAQLNREIAQALTRALTGTVTSKQPLYGHTSEATAYLVADYPYGFRERTQIRYWLESKPKKGWRFVSQTLNPKTGRWNKPKESTYTEWGAAMYLDENGHVQWDGVGPYTDAQKVRAFVETFPGADMREIRKVVPAKLRHLQRELSGKIFWAINGVRHPMSESDVERMRNEMVIWEEIGRLVDRTA